MFPRLRAFAHLRPALASMALSGILLAAMTAGYEGHRIAQIAVLSLPLLLWLRVPLASSQWRRVRYGAVTGVAGLFVLDGVVRAFIRDRYQALPDSSMVLGAVANTTSREAIEYASSQGSMFALLVASVLLGLAAVSALVAICNRHGAPIVGRARWAMALLLLLCAVGLASKPWRRHHPLLFWPAWVQSVQALHVAWSDQDRQRQELMANAQAAGVRVALAGPSTVVLVLTDSVNRDNMSLYGYPRQTTPELAALQELERGRLLMLRFAWSVEPATLESLSGIFSFGSRDPDDPVRGTQHVLALARAAGYRVWWLSNHDDVAIEQQHARLADTVEMINREPGRSSSSLDGELLDELEGALANATPRKLIVLHLLGAHPHYGLRAPDETATGPLSDDAVDAEMSGEGRPSWLRSTRRLYDRAIRYHDTVVAQTLRLTRQHAPPGGEAAWMFLSDHGQEVGHDADHAGHSPGTLAGYRIPALVWRSSAPFPGDIALRPFRADWAGWTLARLLGLEWQGNAPERDVLDPRYGWIAPTLKIPVARFDQ